MLRDRKVVYGLELSKALCYYSGESWTCITHNRDRNAAANNMLSIFRYSLINGTKPDSFTRKTIQAEMVLANLIPTTAD